MAKIQSSINSSIVQGTVNTVEYLAVKIPRSEGAKAVFITHIEMDLSAPDNVATDTSAWIRGAIAAGNQIIVSAALSEKGTLTTREVRKTITDTTLGESIQYVYDGPAVKSGMFQIPMDEDGTYYFTVGILGGSCVAARNVFFRIDFLIVV